MDQRKAYTRKKPVLAANTSINPYGELGKIPPQATELEEVVLGALMIDNHNLSEVMDILSVETFYKYEHQLIFGAISKLFIDSHPVDLMTVAALLRKTGELDAAGGVSYLAALTARVGTAAHLEYHARILIQKEIQRNLIGVANEIIESAYSENTDALQLLDDAERKLFEVTQKKIKRNFVQISDLISQAKKHIQDANGRTEQLKGVTGVSSGFKDLDTITAGWQPSDLIIVAARPAMGKTAFVLSLARNAAIMAKKPVAFFSLEMSSIQLVMRLMSGETMLKSDKFKRGDLADHEWHQLEAKIKELSDAPLFIDDTPALKIFDLRAKARRLKANHDIQLIIIDYLQLMHVDGRDDGAKIGSREQEISTISRSLKVLAKELNIPIIALSQLSREVEKRNDKIPMLSDLRESGAIEQDADMVMFIHRPEYYKILTDENGESTLGKANILIEKHRNGATGKVTLRFNHEYSKFEENDTSFGRFSSHSIALSPSVEFDDIESNTITLPSKLNRDRSANPFDDAPSDPGFL